MLKEQRSEWTILVCLTEPSVHLSQSSDDVTFTLHNLQWLPITHRIKHRFLSLANFAGSALNFPF